MRPSSRLDQIPPYLFAQLERKISEKRAAGIDVISLGIGDPDTPTYAPIVEAAQRAVADPSTHTYPTNRGRPEFRRAVAAFYARRFGVTLDPDTEVMAAIGAKECIFNLSLAFLDPGDVALASDPGYPVYTGGPIMAGGEPVLMGLKPELGFAPDFGAIDADHLRRARLMFINYPNNPTGAVVPDGVFESAIELARAHDLLVVHDNAYSETTYDGYVAPSFLATPGAKEVGVEVFSLSKGYNMTGWRCAAIVGNAEAIEQYWRLKSNIDSGNFEAVQLAGAAALAARGRRRRQGDERRSTPAGATWCATRWPRPASTSPRPRPRSTSGHRCRRALPPPPSTASTCSSRRRSSSPPEAPTVPTGRASSGSRSPHPMTACWRLCSG